jgi:probable rRNA maturation factor
LEVEIVNRQRARRVSARALTVFVERLAAELSEGRADSVCVCLVSDRKMSELNRRFRGKRGVTDVLSFPAGDEPDPDGRKHLGDIVISVQRAARQAGEAGHSLRRELERLALHGYLHLLGYDHESDDGAMTRLERRLARRLWTRRPAREARA